MLRFACTALLSAILLLTSTEISGAQASPDSIGGMSPASYRLWTQVELHFSFIANSLSAGDLMQASAHSQLLDKAISSTEVGDLEQERAAELDAAASEIKIRARAITSACEQQSLSAARTEYESLKEPIQRLKNLLLQ